MDVSSVFCFLFDTFKDDSLLNSRKCAEAEEEEEEEEEDDGDGDGDGDVEAENQEE